MSDPSQPEPSIVNRLLIVDDDVEILALLKKFFLQHSYEVEVATDGAAMWAAIARQHPDVIVLDVMLPGQSGLSLCQRVHGELGIPIVMLTAMGELSDRIIGLELGADDYLTKPFDLDELLARLRVLERRTRGTVVNLIRYGSITLDTAGLTVSIDDRPVELQRREFMVLRRLLENIGHVLSRQQLVENIYGWDSDLESNALDVHIHNLRKKFHPELIRTVRGVGYVIDPLPATRQGK